MIFRINLVVLLLKGNWQKLKSLELKLTMKLPVWWKRLVICWIQMLLCRLDTCKWSIK